MLNYLFYRIYKFQNKLVGEEKSSAAFSAILSMGLLFGLNLFTIFIVIDKSTNLLILLESTLGKLQVIPPLVILWLIAIILYFRYCYKSKYKLLISKIESNKKYINVINNILAILYQILTFILFVYGLKYRFS
jgi:hypothetical protein